MDQTGLHRVCAIEERDHLGAGARSVRVERRAGSAGGDAVLHSPENRLIIIGGGAHVRERIACALRSRSALRAPEEGDDMRTRALAVRAEGAVGIAGGNVVLHCPEDCLIVIGRGADVLERVHRGRGLRLTRTAPEERDHLSAGRYSTSLPERH